MSPSLEELDKRISGLEKKAKGKFKVFLQYLLSPLLVLIIGLIFNWQLEKDRREIQQLQIAQSMLKTLFSEDEHKIMATKRLMEEVLEDANLKEEIGSIVEDYLSSRFDKFLKKKDYESAHEIFAAVESMAGETGEDLKKRFADDPDRKKAINAFEMAENHELEGFQALIREDFESALFNFEKAARIFPDFHSVSAIFNLLKRNSSRFGDPNTVRQIITEIVEKYSGEGPPHLIEELRRKIHQY